LDAVANTRISATNEIYDYLRGADGKVKIQSSKVRGGGTFIFSLTDVQASGYTYNSALNVESSDLITNP